MCTIKGISMHNAVNPVQCNQCNHCNHCNPPSVRSVIWTFWCFGRCAIDCQCVGLNHVLVNVSTSLEGSLPKYWACIQVQVMHVFQDAWVRWPLEIQLFVYSGLATQIVGRRLATHDCQCLWLMWHLLFCCCFQLTFAWMFLFYLFYFCFNCWQ